MTNKEFIDRPMLGKETFEGCPMIIKTRVKENENEKPGKSSEAEKGDFEITSGPTITIKAGNMTCKRDDNGKVSYKIAEEPERQIEEPEK